MSGRRPNPDTRHHCSTTQQLHEFSLVGWDQINTYSRKRIIYYSAYAKYCLIKVQNEDKYASNYVHSKYKQKKKSHNISFVNEISLKGPVQWLTSNLQMRPRGAVCHANTHALLHVDGASVLIRACVPCWCWGCTVNARDSSRIALLSSTLHSELWWRLSVAGWGVARFRGETNTPASTIGGRVRDSPWRERSLKPIWLTE